jgi:hypothetical protein
MIDDSVAANFASEICIVAKTHDPRFVVDVTKEGVVGNPWHRSL